MSRTIQCNHCGVVLALPEQAEGRRMKCPQCGEKFYVGTGAVGVDTPPSSSNPAVGPNSTVILDKRPSSGDLPSLPPSPAPMRETFDLPLMTEPAAAKGKSAVGPAPGKSTIGPAPGKSTIGPAPGKSAVGPASGKSTIGPAPGKSSGGPAAGKSSVGPAPAPAPVADALALFEDSPAPRRKKTGAEARKESRRCPTCGGVVPVGMSICQTCGLDLDTGTRVDLADDLSPPPPPPDPGLPIPMYVVGGLCLAASLALGVVSMVKWYFGTPGLIYFVPLAGFGVYGAVQFLRARTNKLLLAALTLGAVISVIALIAMPIYNSQVDAPVVALTNPDVDPDSVGEAIKPLAERLDSDSVFTGIGLLFLYAGLSIYLISPGVRKHMHRV